MRNQGFTLIEHEHSRSVSRNEGFTLIELLIYLAIVSSVLVLTIGFMWNIILGDIKGNSLMEVRQNGEFVLTKITQEIKKAKSINIPLIGLEGDSLSLEMVDPDLNPTIFDVSGGKLRITQGSRLPIDLTSDGVAVSNFLFRNLSYDNTPGTIRVEMEISRLNFSDRAEYQASQNFRSTVSLLYGP